MERSSSRMTAVTVCDFALGAIVEELLKILRAVLHARFERLQERRLDLGPEFFEPIFDKSRRAFCAAAAA